MKAAVPDFANAHALVIGIADYARVSSLPAVVTRDAADVVALLSDPQICGYDPAKVRLLINADASAAGIRNALADLATKVSVDEAFLLYFSGHGDRRGAAGAEQSYLVAHDTDLAIPNSAISDSELFELLAMVPSRRQVVILDACHAGGVGSLKAENTKEGPKGIGQSALDKLGAGTGRVILASSRADEYSHILHGWNNSVFTDSLLKALQGGARAKSDGTIGVFDLFDFVSDDVPKHQVNQHPVFKADNLEGNFSIASHGAVRHKAPTLAGSGKPPSAVLFSSIYPQGPMENEIWSRAGGDVARLSLSGNGVAQWHKAIQLINNGGGGLTMADLLSTAAADFPEKHELSTLLAQLN